MAAPPVDSTWEYWSARRPNPNALSGSLSIGDRELDVDRIIVRLRTDESKMLLAVSLFHPMFAAMTDQERARVSFLVLDWALGEDEVERWVGRIDTVTERPDRRQSVPINYLDQVTAILAANQGEVRWVVVRGRGPSGSPLIALARRPLKWIDFPLFDQHIAVTIPYEPAGDGGMLTPTALDQLHEAESNLINAASPDVPWQPMSRLAATVPLTCMPIATTQSTLRLSRNGCGVTERGRAAIPAWTQDGPSFDPSHRRMGELLDGFQAITRCSGHPPLPPAWRSS